MLSNCAKKITVKRSLKSLAAMRNEVRRFLAALELSWRDEARMVLAVDEAVGNIIIHNNFRREDPIEVTLRNAEGAVEVTIRDSGRQFDPRPRLRAKPDHKHWGLYIIKQATDEVRYRFVPEGYNELTLVKRARGKVEDL